MPHRPVLPPRPSNWPFEASETSKSSASPAMTKCSRLCDDQALVEELPVPRLPPHYSTNSFLITFAADPRHHSLLSFSPIGPNNSPVSTRQSTCYTAKTGLRQGVAPATHPSRNPSRKPMLTQPRLTQPPHAAYLTQPPHATTSRNPGGGCVSVAHPRFTPTIYTRCVPTPRFAKHPHKRHE